MCTGYIVKGGMVITIPAGTNKRAYCVLHGGRFHIELLCCLWIYALCQKAVIVRICPDQINYVNQVVVTGMSASGTDAAQEPCSVKSIIKGLFQFGLYIKATMILS